MGDSQVAPAPEVQVADTLVAFMHVGDLRPGMPTIKELEGRPVVTLPVDWVRYGAVRGVERQLDNLTKQRQNKFGHDPKSDWQTHINGALGELAVAAYLGRQWDGNVGDLDAMDVGNYQVRTASAPATDGRRRLILHPDDWIGDCFIHVVGLNGIYRLMGWVYGSEGQLQEYWTDVGHGRPAYFVPNRALHPIHQLPPEEEGRL